MKTNFTTATLWSLFLACACLAYGRAEDLNAAESFISIQESILSITRKIDDGHYTDIVETNKYVPDEGFTFSEKAQEQLKAITSTLNDDEVFRIAVVAASNRSENESEIAVNTALMWICFQKLAETVEGTRILELEAIKSVFSSMGGSNLNFSAQIKELNR